MSLSRTPTAGRASVRVRACRINLFDELQVREGKLARSRIRSLVVEAVADDEPVWSVVSKRIVYQLGLTTHRTWNDWQADGVKFKMAGRTLVGGRKVLVGRTG